MKLAFEDNIPGVSARVWIYSHPFISPFHLFIYCVCVCVAGMVRFLLPSQNFGIFHISSISFCTHASGSSKALWFYMPSLLKAWFYIPSRAEQRTQHCIALIQQTYADIFFFYFNKHDSAVVPDQIVDFQQTQITRFLYVYLCGTGLLFACCIYPFFFK